MLWNHLSPGRRRRRYYALQVIGKLRRLDLTPDEMPAVFGVSAHEFAEIVRGWSVAPPLIEVVARQAYRISPPHFLSTYGPVLCLASWSTAIAIALLR
jgi:hypothetical protein